MDTSAIIVSAGKATRMNGIDKQFAELNGIPTVIRSMMAYEQCESICEIIVSARSECIEKIQLLAQKYNIKKLSHIVSGGDTRQQSVINGIKMVSPSSSMVAVHDGARPLVKPVHIERTIADARVFGGAVLGVPVKDTIKLVSDGLITDTPPRSSLFITQTPQVFKKSVYLRGVEFAMRNCLDFTDDCQLAESIGVKIYMTVGDYTNIKITTPEDLAIAEILLKENY